MKTNSSIQKLTQFSLLLAIEAIVCFTPLGSIPISPAIVATLAHVPIIVTALLMGTKWGGIMGTIAGVFSLLIWSFSPPNPLIAFAFTPVYPPGNIFSVFIAILPRALVGIVAGLIYKLFAKKSPILSYGLAGVLGSLTNTLLVLGGIYLAFGKAYAQALQIEFALLAGIIGTTIATNGVLEAVIGGLVGYFVCKPLKKALSKNKG